MNRRRFLQANVGVLGSSLLAGCPLGEAPPPRPAGDTGTVERIDGIRYFVGEEGHDIPLAEVDEVDGPNCDETHYHALDGNSVTTTLCEEITDPGGCGFGKVSETPIRDLVAFDYPCAGTESE